MDSFVPHCYVGAVVFSGVYIDQCAVFYHDVGWSLGGSGIDEFS
jgi:hypothetical protein